MQFQIEALNVGNNVSDVYSWNRWWRLGKAEMSEGQTCGQGPMLDSELACFGLFETPARFSIFILRRLINYSLFFCSKNCQVQRSKPDWPKEMNWHIWMWLHVCRLNSTVECVPYHLQLSPENALQLIQQYPSAKPPPPHLHLSQRFRYESLTPLQSLIQAYDCLYSVKRHKRKWPTNDMNCVCDDTLTLPTSCMTLWLTVQTMSPLVISWMTHVCSVASLWYQQARWDWRGRWGRSHCGKS